MTRSLHFFMGANSGGGFRNLFDRFAQAEGWHDLIILKGSPGCGKSTMMRRMGEAVEACGVQVEYLHCSGDPDSLDGVYVPSIRAGILDGTAPHIVEPRCPVAVDRCVDLAQFCDLSEAKARREAILEHGTACSEAYREAYRALRAAREMEVSAAEMASACFDEQRLLRRADGVISREMRGKGDGRADCWRFPGSITWKGGVWRFDSVANLCPRVYALQDSFGLSASFLDKIYRAAKSRGYGAILCPDAEDMGRLQHLLLPELGLAFVTDREGMRFTGDAYRRIRVDAMLSGERFTSLRSKLRLTQKLQQTLRGEAIASLREAKRLHDLLEQDYRPVVDFSAVDAVTRWETERWLSRL